jgi:FixJ family two-component response regulator
LIAIVDDDEAVREATKGFMRSLGYSVETFSSAEDFLQSPHVGRALCLIADVNMPGMSGLDLYLRLAATQRSLPTILITAYPSDNIRAAALSAGVTCYLVKPFGDDELMDCIRFALDRPEDSGSVS